MDRELRRIKMDKTVHVSRLIHAGYSDLWTGSMYNTEDTGLSASEWCARTGFKSLSEANEVYRGATRVFLAEPGGEECAHF